MVDTVDSKSTASKACGFESHLPYQFLKGWYLSFTCVVMAELVDAYV